MNQKPKIIRAYTDAEWHQVRAQGVGGSDAGAICGVNRWRTPLDVYRDKIGEGERTPDNELMYWGRELEEIVAREFAKRSGFKVRRKTYTLQHSDRSWQLANIDREVVGQRAVLECKTASIYSAGEWGESGSNDAPASYLLQVAHYMSVLDFQDAYIAVLIGGNDFRIYHIKRDAEIEKMMIDREERFWFEHVVKRLPPAPINTADLATIIDDGTAVEASAEAMAAWAQYAELKGEISELKKAERRFADELKAAIAEHTTLVDSNGLALATYKKSKDGLKFDLKQFETDHPDLYTKYLKRKDGNRTLRMAGGRDA